MKSKFIIVAALLLTLQSQAQPGEQSTKTLLSRVYWQGNPDLASVKAEITKERFNFADVKSGSDPLDLAITNKASLEILEYLASQPGIDFQRGIHEGRTYLHSAAASGNAEASDLLLKKGADMNYLDAHSQTALTYAGFVGRLTLPVLEAFVKHGFDVKKKFETKEDANIWLLSVGGDKDLAITNYVLAKGVSLQSADKNGNTAFNYAAKQGNVEILKALKAKGVKYTDNALLMAAAGPFRSANKIDVYKYLVDELKIKPTAVNNNGQNVLHLIAPKQNQADIIAYFFNKGVDINQADKSGNTPFIAAAGTKSVEAVSLLLPKVKNINAANAKGETAIMNAVKSSNAEVVDLLIKKGADVNAIDKEGNGLGAYLMESNIGMGGRSGFGGGMPVAGAGNGNSPQAATTGGRGAGADNTVTPIQDFTEKVKLLKANGCKLSTAQKDGNTLYHLAIAKNDVAVLKQLSTLGIDINAKNNEGLTALHKAAMLSKNDALMKYLVEAGAKKDIKTSFDETAYDLAKENTFLSKGSVSVDFLK